MSIPAILPLSVAGEAGAKPDAVLLWLGALAFGCIAAALATGAFSPRKVNGPDRVPPDRPAWPLLMAFFGAMGVYLFAISLIAKLRHFSTTAEASPGDSALLSTVPALLALLALLAGDRAVFETCRQDLGMGRRRIGAGVLRGLFGTVLIVPPLFLLGQIMEMIYRALRYQHPAEHPLLHVLGQRPSPLVTGAIIVGACVIAPLFEETLFRGHMQTLLRRAIWRLTTPAPSPATMGFPVITDLPGPHVVPLAAPVPPRPNAWQTWIAIVLTSAVFAFIHPGWSQPIIFVLALCLGYAYERTGNLWVSITIHAAFNSISTVLFLMGLYTH